LLERRYQEETDQQRRQLVAATAELGSLAAAADKLRRSEQELKQQLEDRERIAAQVGD
jgi:hypothetical protein